MGDSAGVGVLETKSGGGVVRGTEERLIGRGRTRRAGAASGRAIRPGGISHQASREAAAAMGRFLSGGSGPPSSRWL